MVNKDGCRKLANLISIQVWETSYSLVSYLRRHLVFTKILLCARCFAKCFNVCVVSCSVMSNSLRPPWTIALPGSSVHEIFQARNAGVGSHSLLQRIFLTEG